MEKKEGRAGNGPGLQGQFGSPMVSDMDMEEAGSVPVMISHSPVVIDNRSLAQFKEALQKSPFPAEDLGSTPPLQACSCQL